MKVSLVVAKGKREGKIVPIHGSQFVIGRHKECQLKANGSTISQHHCAVLLRGGKVFVHDFDSTNGTYVNHERVQGEHELRQGDLLELGRLSFRIRIDADAEEASTPPPEKADDSMVAAMLLRPGDSADSAGILGLMDDSKCGSTILQNPLQHDEAADKSEPSQSPAHQKEPPAATSDKEVASAPAGQSDEIAKKLLDELHRSIRAKHNRPEPG
jgi:predicted component of type VI protein secretion system